MRTKESTVAMARTMIEGLRADAATLTAGADRIEGFAQAIERGQVSPDADPEILHYALWGIYRSYRSVRPQTGEPT